MSVRLRLLALFTAGALAARLRENLDSVVELVNDKADHDPHSKSINVSGQFPAGLVLCAAGTATTRTKCRDGTPDMYQAIVERVVAEYDKLSHECDVASCPRGDFAGCIVRLAGHDFMDFNRKGGGSDACIDFNDPDNAGLEECLVRGGLSNGGDHERPSLEAAWAGFCTTVSLADFIVIAAEALMTRTRPDWIEPVNNFSTFLIWQSEFKFGRVTRQVCRNPPLPNADESCAAVKQNFVDELGLSLRQSTALMGVHTLGRASSQASGYEGFWVSGSHAHTFSNKYFKTLVGAGWGSQKTAKGKFQWVRSDGGPSSEMMLNTDMCLAHSTTAGVNAEIDNDCCLWTFGPELQGGALECTGNYDADNYTAQTAACCHPPWFKRCEGHDATSIVGELGSGTSQAVIDFANDDNVWLHELVPAWNKATENGAKLCGKHRGKHRET